MYNNLSTIPSPSVSPNRWCFLNTYYVSSVAEEMTILFFKYKYKQFYVASECHIGQHRSGLSTKSFSRQSQCNICAVFQPVQFLQTWFLAPEPSQKNIKSYPYLNVSLCSYLNLFLFLVSFLAIYILHCPLLCTSVTLGQFHFLLRKELLVQPTFFDQAVR